MPQPGDQLPHFDGVTLDGQELSYRRLWQQLNVVLFVLPEQLSAATNSYLRALESRLSQLRPQDTALLLSHDPTVGVAINSMVIADRWGEIAHIAPLGFDQTEWPTADDVIEWVNFTRMKCPECPA